MKKLRVLYALLSLLTLLLGISIYILFRDLSHLELFEWLPQLNHLKPAYISLKPSVFSYILMYNLPDMLWFISGILLLRFIWFDNERIQKKYVICFYGIGIIFEISQLSKNIPGTFDWFDLLFMGIGASLESFLYNHFVKRRMT